MKNLLFIAALPQEQEALLAILNQPSQPVTISHSLELTAQCIERHQGKIYITLSGMGNVNAALNLGLILESLAIDLIVLIGVGGALSSSLEIGDMVVTDRVIQHDYFSSLDQGDFRMQPGALLLDKTQALQHDPVMRSSPLPFTLSDLTHRDVTILQGLIASGSEFVGTSERKQQIHQQCQQALLVDMEASAVAVVARKYDTPFLVAKTVSDKLHSDGSIGHDFEHFLSNAAHNAALIGKLISEQFLHNTSDNR